MDAVRNNAENAAGSAAQTASSAAQSTKDTVYSAAQNAQNIAHSSPHGEIGVEPVSGKQGDGTVEKPYDGGNEGGRYHGLLTCTH